MVTSQVPSGATLLDINVLVAMFARNHVHHAIANEWFEQLEGLWATCPLTENSAIRILSQNFNTGLDLTASQVGDFLRELCEDPLHEFWTDSLSLLDERFDLSRVGHAHLTDIYLVGLAMLHEGKLVTFDRHIRTAALKPDGRDSVIVIPT
jgi:toxin-antitoxin system PIN domain toxin